MSDLSKLLDPSVLTVFTYAPAGLGHLRVTSALADGLPKEVTPVLLGSHDQSITFIHRIMSIHPALRYISEVLQEGVAEDWFSRIYRWYLRRHTKITYGQIRDELSQRLTVPKTVLVLATHFGLGHELSAVKQKLETENNIRIILVVQVTDDSPQHIWYVEGVDLILVPSSQTRNQLLNYAATEGLKPTNIAVTPYPVSPQFSRITTEGEWNNKLAQTDPSSTEPIHISIPISGAAVGMSYFRTLISHLYTSCDRCQFHIVARAAPYTYMFLNEIRKLPYISIRVAPHDREIIDKYEQMFVHTPIAFEITKPSEQAFKALLSPDMAGAPILLFVEPVGRQEHDNIAFLKRHDLLPGDTERDRLFDLALSGSADGEKMQSVRDRAIRWRGLELPRNPEHASSVIHWCLKKGIFSRMMHYVPHTDDPEIQEVSPDGVTAFWTEVSKLL